MATIFTLGPPSDTVDLADVAKHAILPDGIQFSPRYKTTVVPVPGAGKFILVEDVPESLEIVAQVDVTGANHNTMVTNWRNIIDKLRKARLFSLDQKGSQVELTVGWDLATNPVVYDVVRGEFPPPPNATHPFSGDWVEGGQLKLLCQPYARAAAATEPSDQTLTNDSTGWTPTALGGDAPTPARLRIRNRQASTNMNFIRAASRSRGTPANFLFPIIPGANAPSGYNVTPFHLTSSIIGLTLWARVRSPSATSASVNVGYRYSDGTWYNIDTFIHATTTWETKSPGNTATDPRTGLGWVPSDVNSYEWGVRKAGTVALDITQVFVHVEYVDRDLVLQTTDLLVTANGAVTDWTTTGVVEGSEWDAVNDPVATPDDATTFISSSTDLQISVYVVQDLPAADRGYRLRPTASAEAFRIAITSNLSDHYGSYRVQVRAKLQTGTDQLQLRWGGPTGTLIANDAVAGGTSGNVQIIDLGRMNIPEQEAPPDVTLASFVFSIWRGTGAANLEIDTIELWPAENYVEFEPTTGPAQNEYAVIDGLAPRPVAFLTNTSGQRTQTLSHIGTPPILEVGTNRFLVRCSRSRTDDRRADTVGTDLKYFTRYELQRGSS